MALQNLSRLKTANQKKAVQIASLEFDFNDLTLVDEHQFFQLPKNAVILRSYFEVIEAGVAASTADIGFDGLDELFNNVDLVALAYTTFVGNLNTLTGKTITFVPSVEQTQGRWRLIIEYVEFDLTTGDLTELVV